MPKRTICISKPSYISTKHHSIVIRQKENEVQVPYEDIWIVILETHAANFSAAALSDLIDAGIGVMLCGKDHMPNGLLLPIAAHSRHAGIVRSQLSISKPLAKEIWQRIVKAKISNQARVLDYCGIDSANVAKYIQKVRSGDSDNREAVAAAEYFKVLLKEGTRREGPYAAALDYGYAILRAGIARTAVAGGWLISQGINHHSELNSFNLVDDLIEPFRPLVDLIVRKHDIREPLTHENKILLAMQFELIVEINGEYTALQNAIQIMFDSFRAAILNDEVDYFLLPTIVPLKRYIAE